MRSADQTTLPYARAQRRRPNGALWLGALISLVFHIGLFYGSDLFPKPVPLRAPPAPEVPMIQMEMPPVEPEHPETVEQSPEPSSSSPIAPPMLRDLPTVIPIDAFVQPLQPPSFGLQISHGLITIPTGTPGHGRGNGFGDIFDIDSLDQAPVVRYRSQPIYPEDLKRRGVSGEVEIEYVIDTSGCVTSLTVLRSTQMELEGPVCTAVRRWTYHPGRKDGRVVNTRVHQVITFNLERP